MAFITNKTLPRQNVFAWSGSNRCVAAARVDAARAVLRRARANTHADPIHGRFRAAWRGAGLLDSAEQRSELRIPVYMEAARAVSQARCAHERPLGAIGGESARGDRRRSLRRRRLSLRGETEKDDGRRYRSGHHDRPGHSAAHRPGNPGAVAAACRRGSRREREQLRRRL